MSGYFSTTRHGAARKREDGKAGNEVPSRHAPTFSPDGESGTNSENGDPMRNSAVTLSENKSSRRLTKSAAVAPQGAL